jgi:hypothetical protein
MVQIDDDDAVIMFQTNIYGKDITVDVLDFVCRYTTASGDTGFAEVLPEQSYDSTLENNLSFPFKIENDEEVLFGYEIPIDTTSVELVFTGADSELTDNLTGNNGAMVIMRTTPQSPQ